MRVFSGIQPTGRAHLGNYLGAIRTWVKDQETYDAFFTIVDLHAITIPQDPTTLRRGTLELLATLFAVGLDPKKCTVFIQSQVSAHAELSWLLECTATMGELNRMTQFKDKGRSNESARAGLFTYPVLMASDILLYQTDLVPVGDDQKQHLELTRDLAIRFNNTYGNIFTVPQPAIGSIAARVMDLADPSKKMSKSSATPLGLIYIDDSPADIKRKIAKAVTDTDNRVDYDPINKPGLSNLIEIFAALSNESPGDIALRYQSYGVLKSDLSDLTVETLVPISNRINELLQDETELLRLAEIGSERAATIANKTLDAVKDAMGFVPRR